MENKTIFKEVAAQWLADKKNYVRKSTYATYTLLLQGHLMPLLGDKTQVTESDVQLLVNTKLQGGLSHKTVKDILVVLKMIMRYALKYGLMDAPAMDIHFPTPRERHCIQVLSLSNQRVLLSYLRDNVSPLNLGIYICLTAGLRIGEICALRWADIDLRCGVIRITRTLQRVYFPSGADSHAELLIGPPKTPNSIREIPLTHELTAILRPLKKCACSSDYFLSNSSKPVEPRAYREYFHRLLDRLDMPHIRFHGLRHSFATRCIESKCDYKTVSVLLGHSNISTTLNLYVHPNMDQKRHCISAMDRLLENGRVCR